MISPCCRYVSTWPLSYLEDASDNVNINKIIIVDSSISSLHHHIYIPLTSVMTYYSSKKSRHLPYPQPFTDTMENLDSHQTPTTNFNNISIKEKQNHLVAEPENLKQGLCQVKALLSLILWYLFSTCTLFLNKHILVLMEPKGEPILLSECGGFVC